MPIESEGASVSVIPVQRSVYDALVCALMYSTFSGVFTARQSAAMMEVSEQEFRQMMDELFYPAYWDVRRATE